MKPRKIDFPMTKDIKIPATIQLIRHKDNAETVILRTILDNGKKVKLEAEIKPDKSKKNWWHLSCGGWEMGSDTEDKHTDTAYLFRTNIEVLNSIIEADKYVEVRIRIPKEDGCSKCPMLTETGWREEGCDEWHRLHRCNYLNVEIYDTDTKNGRCPALTAS